MDNEPANRDWLTSILEEVGLEHFYPKLVNDLQLTKLSHFDFVSEEDLVQLGLSRPAAKRLLAAIKKRKSFVTALKNRIVSKFTPSNFTNINFSATKNKQNHDTPAINSNHGKDALSPNFELGRLTCLINSQDIQVKEEIGNGVHGFVKKGEWTAPNGRVVEVALKILRKDVMSTPCSSFDEFVKEISVMHQLNHPNIIKLYGIVLSSPMMMVTELAPFGNLRDKLRTENGRTPISQLINIGVQIASGMHYLESKRFVHRDLAARNIFITHGKKILIGDLGLMRAIPTQENHYVMSERTKIPYPWCAPESLKQKQFSSSSDVYMFGVTLWEMFSFGKEPWAGLNLNEIFENVSSHSKRLPCPESCPTMVYQTLLQCWNINPASRPNFLTLYQYLSTSYPLEVRSNQSITEASQIRVNDHLIPDEISADYLGITNSDASSRDIGRKVLNCDIGDRILVINGQPEKYWWKGQNQRTFDIGWFPLNATRWMAPRRGTNYISKPLKNSFVHTGHCGLNGRWGNPQSIDPMYLKNPLEPDDKKKFEIVRPAVAGSLRPSDIGFANKNKAKSRLSRLFGVGETIPAHSLLSSSYQKFSNESAQSSSKMTKGEQFSFIKSLSGELPPLEQSSRQIQDEPPLIDLSDDNPILQKDSDKAFSSNSPINSKQQEPSLIDMDDDVGNVTESQPQQLNLRRASDTRLNQIDEIYNLSWAGSWNTGTFYGSNSNIHSAYYCPQDALNDRVDSDLSNRYYSAVAQEDVNRNSAT